MDKNSRAWDILSAIGMVATVLLTWWKVISPSYLFFKERVKKKEMLKNFLRLSLNPCYGIMNRQKQIERNLR